MANRVANKPSERRHQTFKAEYTEQFKCIKPSSKGNQYAFCKYCRQDIKISHGGANDINRHLEQEKRKTNEKAEVSAMNMSQKLTSFAKRDDYSTIKAEVLFTDYVVEHNIAINATDHAGPLFRKMFPDSNIAKQYGAARTKTSHIVASLAEQDATALASNMKKRPYSIATLAN